MKLQELTRQIIGIFFNVYNGLAHGFLESVYVEALDRAVGGAVLVEAKACQCLQAAHKAQTLNYLRATVLEVALLLNFGPKPGVKRRCSTIT